MPTFYSQIEVFQVDSQGNETPVELEGQSYTAPHENGNYYYIAHLKWREEIVAEGIYAFAFKIMDID
ncbi:MAG TPA: hypothetical protein VIG73_06820 [Cerasibacillus sp.]|uniref:hypothetical protein n=1 Tax=Cerasibacillus sp. TaxID=2498711 RepID=UPI002F405772